MPSKKKAPVRGSPQWPLPQIPKEFMDQLVDGPMTAKAVQELSAAFKRALIERAIWAELSHHLGYKPGEDKPDGASNHRNGSTRKTVLTARGVMQLISVHKQQNVLIGVSAEKPRMGDVR